MWLPKLKPRDLERSGSSSTQEIREPTNWSESLARAMICPTTRRSWVWELEAGMGEISRYFIMGELRSMPMILPLRVNTDSGSTGVSSWRPHPKETKPKANTKTLRYEGNQKIIFFP